MFVYIGQSKCFVFLAVWTDITNQPKSEQISIHRGYFMYHRFLQTAWLAQKESDINKYQTSRQYSRSVESKYTVCFTDLEQDSDFLKSFLATFIESIIFRGGRDSSKNWLELKIKPPYVNFACLNQ